MSDDAALLYRHGTDKRPLPPGAIYQAAVADCRKRAEVIETGEAAGVRYAFVARHVRDAECSPIKLLELAAEHPGAGASSSKLNTRRIYDFPDAISSALAIAREREAARA